MTKTLPPRQSAVLLFIRDHIAKHGYSPTIREIGDHMEIPNSNGVMCHLHALRKKGLVDWVDGRPRTIRVKGWLQE